MTSKRQLLLYLSLWVISTTGLVPSAAAEDISDQQELVQRAQSTFERFLAEPGIAAWYVSESPNVKAVFIVPRLWRGAFLVGASGGGGVLLARDFVNGGWSPPAFYRMTSGSVGLQVGADASEVVLAIKTFSGLERFYGMGTAKLGLDGGLSLGPYGEDLSASLDVVSFGATKGAYIGLSLDGFAITANSGDNEHYYGKPVKPEDILANKGVSNAGANGLRGALDRFIH